MAPGEPGQRGLGEDRAAGRKRQAQILHGLVRHPSPAAAQALPGAGRQEVPSPAPAHGDARRRALHGPWRKRTGGPAGRFRVPGRRPRPQQGRRRLPRRQRQRFRRILLARTARGGPDSRRRRRRGDLSQWARAADVRGSQRRIHRRRSAAPGTTGRSNIAVRICRAAPRRRPFRRSTSTPPSPRSSAWRSWASAR